MLYKEDGLYMNVHTSSNAELFFKALEDVWVAEQIWHGSPNNAVWHCTQAAEKTMKGYLRCLNMDYDYGHELNLLLDAVMSNFKISEQTEEYIMYLNDFESKLRYKNLSNDPSPEEARIAISRIKQIIQEFSDNPKVTQFVGEAREVHAKMLRVNIKLENQ